jgi:hypothetical protein
MLSLWISPKITFTMDAGCVQLGWTKEPCPITSEIRDWEKSFRDDSDVRMPRYGYKPEDADNVVAY